MQHSSVVGGSTAKRLLNCPGSAALVASVPPAPSSSYADEGTLLHNIIAQTLDGGPAPHDLVGVAEYNGIVLTEEMVNTKLLPALALLDDLDPFKDGEFMTEARVDFGDFIPGAFGSCDLLLRVGKSAYVIDWKFGNGVPVEAIDNEQLLFYAAAALRGDKTRWVFEGADRIEVVIIQPPSLKRWEVSVPRLLAFERQLRSAVKASEDRAAPVVAGDWCRFCPAKAICPAMTGAADRALKVQMDAIDPRQLGAHLRTADLLEDWIKSVREMSLQRLESGATVPGYKLVAKRATRQWADEAAAVAALTAAGFDESDLMVTELKSPAQVEKVLKKTKTAMPDGIIVAISSGHTLAPMEDPRPAVLQIGQQLTAALSKLQ